MEQLQLDRQVVTGEMFALKDTAFGGLEFIGFDSLPPAKIDPALDEDISTAVAIPPKPLRHRRAKTPTRPHLVPIWLDDGEFRKLAESANAAGLALPDYLRARALKDPKVQVRPTEPGPDLFLPIASPSSVAAPPSDPEPIIAELPPDLEERISAYYALRERSNAISYGRAAGDLRRPNRFSRLGHILIELFGTRLLGDRALSREGT